jgi:hypothetical protein
MPKLKLKQLVHEADTWKRIIAFMVEENIILKNRLSEILQEGFNTELLNDVELFQNRIIREDSMIGLLRDQMQELDKLLVREVFENGKIIRLVERNLDKLRNNIKNGELEFGKLKEDFNRYFSENI